MGSYLSSFFYETPDATPTSSDDEEEVEESEVDDVPATVSVSLTPLEPLPLVVGTPTLVPPLPLVVGTPALVPPLSLVSASLALVVEKPTPIEPIPLVAGTTVVSSVIAPLPPVAVSIDTISLAPSTASPPDDSIYIILTCLDDSTPINSLFLASNITVKDAATLQVVLYGTINTILNNPASLNVKPVHNLGDMGLRIVPNWFNAIGFGLPSTIDQLFEIIIDTTDTSFSNRKLILVQNGVIIYTSAPFGIGRSYSVDLINPTVYVIK